MELEGVRLGLVCFWVSFCREQVALRAPVNIDEETEAAIAAAFEGRDGKMNLEEFREAVVGPLLGLGPFLAGQSPKP